MEAGRDLDLKPFGIRAMDSLRIEKSYGLIGTELSIEYAALESGLDRFVKPDKGDFIGWTSLLAWRERGFDNTLVTLEVRGFNGADALGNNPLRIQGEVVGRTTSGNYGYRLGQSLALAMLKPEFAAPGTVLDIAVLGHNGTATVLADSPYDPNNRCPHG